MDETTQRSVDRPLDRRRAMKSIGLVGVGIPRVELSPASASTTLVTCHGRDADTLSDALVAAAERARDDLEPAVSGTIETIEIGSVPFRSAEYDCDADGMRRFLADVLSDLHEKYDLPDGAYVNVGHGNSVGAGLSPCWGYGGGTTTVYSPDERRLHGVLTYTGFGITRLEVRQMGMHEFGHLWGADHGDGEYEIHDGRVRRITPMLSAYLADSDGVHDTTFPGTGTYPETTCSDRPVPSEHPHGGSNVLDGDHVQEYSDCTRRAFADADGSELEQSAVR